jgi:hypothetical protein
MRYVRGFLMAGLAWFAAGCMQFEYGIQLEEDLSGTANLDVEVDLERVAYISAYVQNAFAGEGGEPTGDQIQAAREEILAEMDDEEFSEDSIRAEIEPDLPEGVELEYARVDRDELLTTINMKFRFDHVDKLKEMRLDDDEGDDAPVDAEPFENLEITEDGDEIIIRSEPIDPMEEMEDMPWLSDEMVEKIMEGFSVTFSVSTPFRIEEHNATRRDGDRLVWMFNLETLKAGEPTGIYARFKR